MTQYDGSEGTAVKIAKAGPYGSTNDGGSVSLYRGLGKKISEGVLTVEYDINAASALGSSDMGGKALHQLVLDAYPNALTSEQTAFENATNKVGDSAFIKYINGIQGGALFVAKNTGKLTDGSDYLNADFRDWGFSKNSWHHIKTTFDFDAETVQTNIDSADKGSAYALSDFGLEDGVAAIGFNQAWNAQNTEVYLDNVTVKHTVDRGGAKVSNVRFVDGKGNKSGVSSSVSTLTEKIEIAFSAAVDESTLSNGVTLSDKNGDEIVLTGSFNGETNVYSATLGDLMKKDTEYTLTAANLTSGGKLIEDYSVSFKTAASGVFDVSKPYINGTIAAGNTITIGIKVLNTTGENKNVTFSYATYSGNQMIGCELEEKGVGGESSGIYTKEYTLTLDAETAAKLTDIRAFVWGDLTSVVPLTDFASLTK